MPEPLEVEEERFHQAEQIPEPEPSEVYQRAEDESGFYFVEEGTEPPELPESRKPKGNFCLLYTSPSPRDRSLSRMPSSA